ncbi:MAG TPA: glycosyltransferase family 39 protein [Solirubrobacterales bacterium]|nr:glycosyltransferase family 39 protein [Solirubrobacterales bacterium]
MWARLQNACDGRRAALALIAISLLGLGLRLDYAIRAPQHPVDDARAYARISRALYEGEGYTQGPGFGYLQSASNYQPGLPLTVAGLYEVRRAPDERFARIVLVLLSALAVPFAFAIGRRLGGSAAGLIAAAAVAIYPALLEYSGMLMTEPVGTALLAGAYLLVLRAHERQRPWRWAAAGLAIGALAMLRPEYLPFVIVLPALAAWPWRRGAPGGARRWRLAALMAGCALLVLLPWTVRNYVAFERLVPLSTGGGQVLYEGSYLPAGPNPENITPVLLERYPWLRNELGPAPGPIYRGQAVAALAHRQRPGENTDAALTGMAIDAYTTAAREEPLQLAGFLAGKVWFAWTDPARGVMHLPLWRALQIALLAAAALGLAVGLAQRRFDVAAIAAILLLVTLVQAVYIASPRRTLTLLPLTSALAGYGIVWLWAQIWKVGPRVSQKRSPYSPAST